MTETGTLRLYCERPRLASGWPAPHDLVVRARIDGRDVPVRWGFSDLPIHAGPHELRVWVPPVFGYGGFQHIDNAVTHTVTIEPDHIQHLYYRAAGRPTVRGHLAPDPLPPLPDSTRAKRVTYVGLLLWLAYTFWFTWH